MKLRPIKWYQKLLTTKGRKREGYYIVEGIRQVTQVIDAASNDIDEILLLEGEPEPTTSLLIRTLSSAQMSSVSDSETAPKIIAICRIPTDVKSETLPSKLPNKILFLEDVQDPGNLGTLLRSAAAFNFTLVIMTENCADPFAPKVVRSTAGALLSLNLRRSAHSFDFLSNLRSNSYSIVTADINGGNSTPSSDKKTIFALGNEGNGVSDTLLSISDHIYTIPFNSNNVESLNVAVAGSIGMAQMCQEG